ncbi:hypothetical protein ACFXO9_26895 [Nocardia tengchongensis]|uniref:hypothetical protein n=1 Tax=Nocardia tengchongensis TaxID=2055889 RepID=UPI0036CAF62D
MASTDQPDIPHEFSTFRPPSSPRNVRDDISSTPTTSHSHPESALPDTDHNEFPRPSVAATGSNSQDDRRTGAETLLSLRLPSTPPTRLGNSRLPVPRVFDSAPFTALPLHMAITAISDRGRLAASALVESLGWPARQQVSFEVLADDLVIVRPSSTGPYRIDRRHHSASLPTFAREPDWASANESYSSRPRSVRSRPSTQSTLSSEACAR